MLGHQMPGKPRHVGERPDVLDCVAQLNDHVPARDVGAMSRDRVRCVPIALGQSVVQDPRDAGWEARPGMIVQQVARASKQMPQAASVKGLRELPVRDPAITFELTGETGADDCGGVVKPVVRADAVDRGQARRRHP